MTPRPLSTAELEQRRGAAVKHGGRAQRRIATRAERKWKQLRDGLNDRGIRVLRDVTPRDWLQLRFLVRYLVVIEALEPYIDQLLETPARAVQEDALERYMNTLSAASALVAKLPPKLTERALGSGLARDLSRYATPPRPSERS